MNGQGRMCEAQKVIDKTSRPRIDYQLEQWEARDFPFFSIESYVLSLSLSLSPFN